MSVFMAERLDYMTFKDPFHLKGFCDSLVHVRFLARDGSRQCYFREMLNQKWTANEGHGKPFWRAPMDKT